MKRAEPRPAAVPPKPVAVVVAVDGFEPAAPSTTNDHDGGVRNTFSAKLPDAG